jgi:plastocyanin
MSAALKATITRSAGAFFLCVSTVFAADVTASARTIDIRNFAFAPSTLTIPVGTQVVWINRDDEPHLIASAGGQFASSHALDTSDSYVVTFSKPGTYAYYCSIHPMMVGTIIVH